VPTLTFADKAPIWLFAAIPGGEAPKTNIERIQAKARELALRQVPGMASNAFELRFEAGYEEAREWLHGAAAQYEFERLCQSAREAKNEAA
jgi:hypothetical protein